MIEQAFSAIGKAIQQIAEERRQTTLKTLQNRGYNVDLAVLQAADSSATPVSKFIKEPGFFEIRINYAVLQAFLRQLQIAVTENAQWIRQNFLGRDLEHSEHQTLVRNLLLRSALYNELGNAIQVMYHEPCRILDFYLFLPLAKGGTSLSSSIVAKASLSGGKFRKKLNLQKTVRFEEDTRFGKIFNENLKLTGQPIEDTDPDHFVWKILNTLFEIVIEDEYAYQDLYLRARTYFLCFSFKVEDHEGLIHNETETESETEIENEIDNEYLPLIAFPEIQEKVKEEGLVDSSPSGEYVCEVCGTPMERVGKLSKRKNKLWTDDQSFFILPHQLDCYCDDCFNLITKGIAYAEERLSFYLGSDQGNSYNLFVLPICTDIGALFQVLKAMDEARYQDAGLRAPSLTGADIYKARERILARLREDATEEELSAADAANRKSDAAYTVHLDLNRIIPGLANLIQDQREGLPRNLRFLFCEYYISNQYYRIVDLAVHDLTGFDRLNNGWEALKEAGYKPFSARQLIDVLPAHKASKFLLALYRGTGEFDQVEFKALAWQTLQPLFSKYMVNPTQNSVSLLMKIRTVEKYLWIMNWFQSHPQGGERENE